MTDDDRQELEESRAIRADLRKRAIEENDPKAQALLGEWYLNRKGEAAMWYRLAAEQGHAEAQYMLGLLLYEGDGLEHHVPMRASWENDDYQKRRREQGFAEAAHWLRKAAHREGYAKARTRLGFLYLYGEGVRQDDDEALRLFREAAELEDAEAQYTLGLLYELGRGVGENTDEAERWKRRARSTRSTKYGYEGYDYFDSPIHANTLGRLKKDVEQEKRRASFQKEQQARNRKVAEYLDYAQRVREEYYSLAKRFGFYKSCFLFAVFGAALAVILLWVGTAWIWVGLLVLAVVNVLGNSFLGAMTASSWSIGGVWADLEHQLRRIAHEADQGEKDILDESRIQLRAVSEQMDAVRHGLVGRWLSWDPTLIEVPSLYPYPSTDADKKWERREPPKQRKDVLSLVVGGLVALAVIIGVAVGAFKEWTDPVADFVAAKLDNLARTTRPDGASTSEPPLQVLLGEGTFGKSLDEMVAMWLEDYEEWNGDVEGWMRSKGMGSTLDEQMAGAVGLFKSSAFLPEIQQMALLHGWADDLGVCNEIAEFLEQQEPGRYACNFLANVDVRDGTIRMRTR